MDISGLMPFVGGKVRIWIQDWSGEEPAKPVEHTLYRLEMTEDDCLKFYVNATQFVSVPIFGDARTYLDTEQQPPCFVSKDENSKLNYHIFFLS